jgi:hypothetical protein
MSSATRRIRSELAATILAALGSPQDQTRQTTEQERTDAAEARALRRVWFVFRR